MTLSSFFRRSLLDADRWSSAVCKKNTQLIDSPTRSGGAIFVPADLLARQCPWCPGDCRLSGLASSTPSPSLHFPGLASFSPGLAFCFPSPASYSPSLALHFPSLVFHFPGPEAFSPSLEEFSPGGLERWTGGKQRAAWVRERRYTARRGPSGGGSR